MIGFLIIAFMSCFVLVCYLRMFLTKMQNNYITYGQPTWYDVLRGIGLLFNMICLGVLLTQILIHD